MDAAEKLATDVGTAAACRAMGVSRATVYRRRDRQTTGGADRCRRRQPRTLLDCERQAVLDVLHSPRFVDKSPATVYAALLDEGTYLCSIRTMYRLLHDADEVRERRDPLRHPNYRKPEFPNRFGSQEDARAFCQDFFTWYNDEHYHSGIGLLTPATVHYGDTAEVLAGRKQTLDAAYATHPERFVGKPPAPLALPETVWINPPLGSATAHEKGLPRTVGSRKPDAPSAHPRSDYPSPGCVPAEPGSVSPDALNLTETVVLQHPPSDTRAMPKKIPGAWGLAPTSKQNCSRSETTIH